MKNLARNQSQHGVDDVICFITSTYESSRNSISGPTPSCTISLIALNICIVLLSRLVMHIFKAMRDIVQEGVGHEIEFMLDS